MFHGDKIKKVPCEIILWHILPVIRKEFTKSLMRDYSLSQKQVAGLLGITPAAVCQYISDKRGYYNITDNDILEEIEKSAEILFHNESENIIYETCRICTIIKSKGIIEKIAKFIENNGNWSEINENTL